ncbi:uncharacterized protein LOC118647196 [Monomorium pharaonis]|uniref:uncharacterized protein LOC118647196 n=1 Tax=Monomorium pharaonis TaxID=307658 RepID=UPI001746397E|nr:uncharacterized protein LOC118647196 [Monomorium pharaonis]
MNTSYDHQLKHTIRKLSETPHQQAWSPVRTPLLTAYKEFSKYAEWFPNGSTSENAVSSGFAVISGSGEILGVYRTAGFVSSFCVEAMAILESLRIIRSKKWKAATIFSDSKSTISAIKAEFKPNHSSHIILDIKDNLWNLKQEGFSVKLVWIPSHKGIPGNERADIAAKQASISGQRSNNDIPIREAKNLWKKVTRQESEKWCREKSQFRGSYYFTNFETASNHSWFDTYNLRRRIITSINRLRSGHTSLHASLFRFLIVDLPNCPYCGEYETPEHVFWSCFKYSEQRLTLLNDLSKVLSFGPYSLEYLLSLPSSEILYALEKL